ncbi:DUF6588 family protein [Pedobacter rhizosphaerae]|uniref:Outer membrane protein beta-barrel domain-containing protein n=1 Tax=Pedobacter rhizosphaerae TaxID=390241 RepID=A0A1H9K5S4_9SPHI|nr:DUF6588 family protein [Pedobacter rhizosphaerae]SEQ94412.1 hypothetical protein SAMN04488023_102227 [Pedobacter rhizosphaerae]
MKKLYPLKSLVGLLLAFSAGSVKAQQDVGDLFVSGPADATKLINAYFDPLYKGLGVGLSDGWNNTARSKGFLKFEVRVSASAAFVPQSARSYDVNTLGLNNIKPALGSSSIGPTAFGNDQEGGRMEVYTSAGIPTGKFFNLPQGLGFHVVPAAQIQATLGLPKNIDISLRAMPKIKLGSDLGSLSMIGFGAKIELLPLFMGKSEKLIPVDIALAGGFTQYKYTLPLDIDNTANSNQRIDAKFNGVNFDAIVSKKLLFFTPFASVGYQTSKTNLKALGTYKFATGATSSTTYTDPVSVNKTDIDGLRGSLGFQLKFGFFKFYGSYTAAKYSMVNAGIGLGIGQ